MRLLTTSNPKVVNFTSEQEIPPYAILSHVWDDAEVSFQQMQNLSSIKPDQKGYIKIVRACELARSDDYEYLWIDTCCIDKTSSAELAEAINSMYEYYRKAEVCYAYLADVPPGPSFETAFRDSKWFTRGWTLQELLAPRAVTFLANDWNDIGTKATLREIITVITGIPSRILLMNVPVTEISVAQRMSWAARRKTTRVEDRAYSLMGLFGVFLPTIYGEGKHAFTTLQEEILKVSDNQTIFAWTSDDRFGGLLAASPDNFKDSGEYEPTTPRTDYQRLPYSITNIGLQIHLPLRPLAAFVFLPLDVDNYHKFWAPLSCRRRGKPEAVVIYVKRSVAPNSHQFERTNLDRLDLIEGSKLGDEKEWKYDPLLFRTRDPELSRVVDDHRRILFSFPDGTLLQYKLFGAYKTNDHTHSNTIALPPLNNGSSCALFFRDEQTRQLFVVLAGKHRDSIWLNIVVDFEEVEFTDGRRSYLHDNEHEEMWWKNVDRTSKFWTDDKIIVVEARPKGRDYMINIRIARKIPDIAPGVTQTPQYTLAVSLSEATLDAGISPLDAYPSDCWKPSGEDTGLNLLLEHSGMSGILFFKGFAIILGIDNDRMWSDILTGSESDPKFAKDICDLYNRVDSIGVRLVGDRNYLSQSKSTEKKEAGMLMSVRGMMVGGLGSKRFQVMITARRLYMHEDGFLRMGYD